MWIDSHCHLNHAKFEGARPSDIVAQAREAGIDGMVNISCQIHGDFQTVLKTAQSHENVWCTVGTHPHDAGKPEELGVSLKDLVELARSDGNIVGIGESGLDYYYDFSPREDQENSFRKHIQACLETDLPLVIHARDADADIIRVMREEAGHHNDAGLRGVMHCFSSGPGLAEESLAFGFYLSFSGIITFQSAEELRAIAAKTPLDCLLVETDAPYLAPVPYRGKTNMPAYVPHTGAKLAELHDVSAYEMAKVTTANFFRLFDKARLACV